MAVNFQQLNTSNFATAQQLQALINDSTQGANTTYSSNKIVGITGALSGLNTTQKGSLVGAVNEVDGNVGDMTQLTTSKKDSLVDAVNELNAQFYIVDVPASTITANVTYNDGLDTSLFAVDLPASIGIAEQDDYRNTIVVLGYVFNYGSAQEQTLKQYLLDDRKTPEITSGIYDGFAMDASMTASGSLECTLTAGVYNDTGASIFKAQAGNLMILVAIKQNATVVAGT